MNESQPVANGSAVADGDAVQPPWEFYRTCIIAGLVGGFLNGCAASVLIVVTTVTRQGGTGALGPYRIFCTIE